MLWLASVSTAWSSADILLSWMIPECAYLLPADGHDWCMTRWSIKNSGMWRGCPILRKYRTSTSLLFNIVDTSSFRPSNGRNALISLSLVVPTFSYQHGALARKFNSSPRSYKPEHRTQPQRLDDCSSPNKSAHSGSSKVMVEQKP